MKGLNCGHKCSLKPLMLTFTHIRQWVQCLWSEYICETLFHHRVASTPELATNFIDYKQMAGIMTVRKNCYYTVLSRRYAIRWIIFLSEHIYLWNIHPTMIWKWFLVDFFTVIVAAWYREKSCQLQNSPWNLVSGGCQLNPLLCTCIDITSVYIEAKVFSKN